MFSGKGPWDLALACLFTHIDQFSSICNTQVLTILHVTFASLCFGFFTWNSLSILFCLAKLFTQDSAWASPTGRKPSPNRTIVLNGHSLDSHSTLGVSQFLITFYFIFKQPVYLSISRINNLSWEKLDKILTIFVSLVLILGIEYFFVFKWTDRTLFWLVLFWGPITELGLLSQKLKVPLKPAAQFPGY